jgi:hypothetical protein
MEKEYDFSGGQRGKFYRPDAKLNFPVFLNEENYSFFMALAKRKNIDISLVVNKILEEDKKLAEFIR